AADGLFVPGVGNFHACLAGLRAADGPLIVERRLAAGRPVLGVCVGMQVLFDASDEPSEAPLAGLGRWRGTVSRLGARVVPHMGWSTVDVPAGSTLFAGVEAERFYFVHSYAVHRWEQPRSEPTPAPPIVIRAEHGEPFVAAVESGPLMATQFHPEKSGDAGLALLDNWICTL
ncbi:MAG: imidazole glycerol phosphate synthase subunit HisH, partial [Phycicoccus sp.]